MNADKTGINADKMGMLGWRRARFSTVDKDIGVGSPASCLTGLLVT